MFWAWIWGAGFVTNNPVREVIHTLIPVDNHRLIHRVLHNFVDNLQTGEKETRRNQAKDKVTWQNYPTFAPANNVPRNKIILKLSPPA
jgi:hypothetical protein